jgi:hypothetical protein
VWGDKTLSKIYLADLLIAARQKLADLKATVTTKGVSEKWAEEKQRYEMALAIDKTCAASHPNEGDRIKDRALSFLWLLRK